MGVLSQSDRSFITKSDKYSRARAFDKGHGELSPWNSNASLTTHWWSVFAHRIDSWNDINIETRGLTRLLQVWFTMHFKLCYQNHRPGPCRIWLWDFFTIEIQYHNMKLGVAYRTLVQLGCIQLEVTGAGSSLQEVVPQMSLMPPSI